MRMVEGGRGEDSGLGTEVGEKEKQGRKYAGVVNEEGGRRKRGRFRVRDRGRGRRKAREEICRNSE